MTTFLCLLIFLSGLSVGWLLREDFLIRWFLRDQLGVREWLTKQAIKRRL